jgi:hypothetical protein
LRKLEEPVHPQQSESNAVSDESQTLELFSLTSSEFTMLVNKGISVGDIMILLLMQVETGNLETLTVMLRFLIRYDSHSLPVSNVFISRQIVDEPLVKQITVDIQQAVNQIYQSSLRI